MLKFSFVINLKICDSFVDVTSLNYITNKKSAFFVLTKKTAVEINILGLQLINLVKNYYLLYPININEV